MGSSPCARLREDRAAERRRTHQAALSSSFAWRRAAASSRSAPSIRTSSPTTSALPQLGDGGARGLAGGVLDDREVAVGQRRDLRQVRDADDLAARRRARAAARRRRGRSAPPMPASTSSKTSVAGPASAATPISASITRESSPPEAISRSGPAGTPGLGAIRNSTSSAPGRPEAVARGASAAVNSAPSIASAASRSRTASASAAPAAVAGRAERRGAARRARRGRRRARARRSRSPPRRRPARRGARGRSSA